MFLPALNLLSICFKGFKKINSIKGNVFNIGGGINNNLSLLELITLLEYVLNIKMDYKELAFRESDQLVFVDNYQKASKLIGWAASKKPLVGIEESIK